MRTTIFLSVSALVAVVGAFGCSHDQPAAKTAVDYDTTPVSTTQTTNAPVSQKTDQVVNVGPDLRKACGINDVNDAPKFDFDSSNLSSNDRNVLNQISTCLTSGPLKGHAVSLVGRADPRGESEYNMNLGAQRAMAAKGYLQQLGIAPDRLHDTSRGAMDATGHDEESWRIDRRVDVELAD